MKASYLRSLFVIAGLPVLGLAGCGGEPTTTSSGGAGGSTNTAGAGGTGGTETTGGSGGATGGTGGAAGGAGGAGGGTAGTGGSGGVETGDYDCSAPEGIVPALKLTEVVNGLNSPVYLRAAPGDNERLYVVEQPGRIRIIKNGTLLPEPFLNITDRVQNSGEQGLLGLAFHPKYAENGRFFVFYTNKSGADQNITEYTRSANADLAVAQADGFGMETQSLLKVIDSEGNHNGGMIDFSPVDGFLYIGLGDEGGGGDNHGPFGNAQNLGTLWGKIARIDVDVKENGNNYGIPAGNMKEIPPNNPTVGTVLPEIWDYGLRNPWRFSFDPCNGDMYMADVGQGVWEEVNVELAGKGNRNYGWKYLEGTHDFSTNTPGFDQNNFTPPVDEYEHNAPGPNENCSVTGGFVYKGSAIPALRGRYFYGDYCSGRIWSFGWDGLAIKDKIDHTDDLQDPGNILSFGYDNVGNVYVLAGGKISRIDAE